MIENISSQLSGITVTNRTLAVGIRIYMGKSNQKNIVLHVEELLKEKYMILQTNSIILSMTNEHKENQWTRCTKKTNGSQ